MVFFSLFVISAVILGAGAMLAPAWPSSAPRIGLSATLLLGIVSGGAVWWAELFGWDTLIIDYLLFAIVSGVILGGTLSKGGENSESGWPSRKELAFFAVVALICMMPLLVLRLPLGNAAAVDIQNSQIIRESGNFDILTPPYDSSEGYAPPAFHALAAYLSQQLRQDIPTIHIALGSLIAFLCIWTVFDLGVEIRDKQLGYIMVIMLFASLGSLSLLWGSYYSQLMSLLFTFAFISYVLRYIRQQRSVDMVAAGLMLGSVLYSSAFFFVLVTLGFYVYLFIRTFRTNRKAKGLSIFSRLMTWLGILLVCLLGTIPWLSESWPALILNDNDPAIYLCICSVLATIAGAYAFSWLNKRFSQRKLKPSPDLERV
jgi:hypothetical protein